VIHIAKHSYTLEREPLRFPFGFKGKYIHEMWQSVVKLYSGSGAIGMGFGGQSVLWSDSEVFERWGENSSNEMMSDITKYALSEAEKTAFNTPLELIESLLEPVYTYGQKCTSMSGLRLTFVLNALVAIDQAAWALFAQERQTFSFQELIPDTYKAALSHRQSLLASIPLVPYGSSEAEVRSLLDEGYFILKIKLGADPDQDGDAGKMLQWDKDRIAFIHRIASEYTTEYTDNGKIAYYFDANGRYENKEQLMQLLDYADQAGALTQTVLLEEPFPENYKVDVMDIPVRLAADESVHSEQDALERIQLGYTALAIKPVAKTMSLSLKIAKLAYDRGVPCFCADLTANPILVDWNKTMAALLAPLPGLKVGVLETNGHQNYKNWQLMLGRHPRGDAEWIKARGGMFSLNDDFFRYSGGALEGS
jgi:L-alanine-DL-glutamate epimerase-like enolase superfamily enzyme